MDYRRVPWKRNFLKLPAALQADLEAVASDLIAIAATKKVPLADIEEGLYLHLGLRIVDGAVVTGDPVHPPADGGKWSERNAFGWDRKRMDLPKITKGFVIESPIYGDAARNGTHTRVWEREVYQRQVFEPQGMLIESAILNERAGEHAVVKFALTPMLERGQPEFELMVLWAANVLQENTGVAGIFATDATREDFIGTIVLDWEVFPPGTIDEVVERIGRRPARPGNAPDFDRHIRDRIALFSALNPTSYIRGQGGFGSYFGAQFADDLVVFENLKYGNALYILYEDWDAVSRRSRLDLLRDHDASFDRIVHTEDWQDKFTVLIRYQLKKRRPRGGRDLFGRR